MTDQPTPTVDSMILDRLDSQDKALERIERRQLDLNGAVRELQLWRAKLEGARLAIKWLPQFLIATAASGVGALLVLVAHP